jgi:hypothetical protein
MLYYIKQFYNILENTNSETQSQKSSYTTEDTVSTQDSKLESVLEGN